MQCSSLSPLSACASDHRSKPPPGQAKYDELRKAEQAANAPEDVSDIIEEQERKRRKKLDAAKDKKSGSYKF